MPAPFPSPLCADSPSHCIVRAQMSGPNAGIMATDYPASRTTSQTKWFIDMQPLAFLAENRPRQHFAIILFAATKNLVSSLIDIALKYSIHLHLSGNILYLSPKFCCFLPTSVSYVFLLRFFSTHYLISEQLRH